LSEIRPLLLNAQRDVSACAKAAQNFVDIAVQRAGDEFREQASRAFDSLGLKLAKEHTKVKELARSDRAVKLSYELGRGTYDMFAKQDTLILAEEINELDAAHRDAMAVEQKIAQRLRFWQGKLDAAGQVRRDMRSKLTRATLSTVKGGIELLQNMMSGFEEAYLREPTND
jgi:hypothetical protein